MTKPSKHKIDLRSHHSDKKKESKVNRTTNHLEAGKLKNGGEVDLSNLQINMGKRLI